MDMERLAEIFEAVRVMPLRPSDMLVFRTNARLGLEQLAELHDRLEEETGHVRILILEGGADLAVLRREEEPRPQREPDPDPGRATHRPLAAAHPRAKAS